MKWHGLVILAGALALFAATGCDPLRDQTFENVGKKKIQLFLIPGDEKEPFLILRPGQTQTARIYNLQQVKVKDAAGKNLYLVDFDSPETLAGRDDNFFIHCRLSSKGLVSIKKD